MVRLIEKAKIMYDDLTEKIRFYKLPKKEQNKIIKQKKKESEIFNKKVMKYHKLMEELNIEKIYEGLSKENFEAKTKQLKEQYKDIFQKPKKNFDKYVTNITLKEFENNLKKYRNTILLEKENKIQLFSRYKSNKEIKEEIIRQNPILKMFA